MLIQVDKTAHRIFFFLFSLLVIIYFFKYDTIVRSSAWSFVHSDSGASSVQKQNTNKKLLELSKSPVKTCNLKIRRQNSLVLIYKHLIQRSNDLQSSSYLGLLNACKLMFAIELSMKRRMWKCWTTLSKTLCTYIITAFLYRTKKFWFNPKVFGRVQIVLKLV